MGCATGCRGQVRKCSRRGCRRLCPGGRAGASEGRWGVGAEGSAPTELGSGTLASGTQRNAKEAVHQLLPRSFLTPRNPAGVQAFASPPLRRGSAGSRGGPPLAPPRLVKSPDDVAFPGLTVAGGDGRTPGSGASGSGRWTRARLVGLRGLTASAQPEIGAETAVCPGRNDGFREEPGAERPLLVSLALSIMAFWLFTLSPDSDPEFWPRDFCFLSILTSGRTTHVGSDAVTRCPCPTSGS